MEDNKYYIPSIEEFHVGFEYEIVLPQWEIQEFRSTIMGVNEDLYAIEKCLKLNRIRVKYLYKEDIESLGFEETIDDTEGNTWYKKDRIKLCFVEGLNFNIEICDNYASKLNDTIFKGIVKNKSELKKLLKQLGIDGK